MVAKAMNRKAVPVYEARGFRSGETVGALVALARNALWEAVPGAHARCRRDNVGRRPDQGDGPRGPRAARAGLPPSARRAHSTRRQARTLGRQQQVSGDVARLSPPIDSILRLAGRTP